jgi:hypothetical protein
VDEKAAVVTGAALVVDATPRQRQHREDDFIERERSYLCTLLNLCSAIHNEDGTLKVTSNRNGRFSGILRFTLQQHLHKKSVYDIPEISMNIYTRKIFVSLKVLIYFSFFPFCGTSSTSPCVQTDTRIAYTWKESFLEIWCWGVWYTTFKNNGRQK